MRFRKKPVIIEAMRFDGGNGYDIAHWARAGLPDIAQAKIILSNPYLFVNTLEGEMRADIGDWIIKGVKGEFYPCKPDIFEATYEAVNA